MSEQLATPPPASEAELVGRAEALAGLRLADVAERRGIPVPPDLRRAKGWVGTLMEGVLGATASSRDAPDFEAIGVELKTLPVTRAGKPCESTFVCTIDLLRIGETEWEASRLRRKIARVLWVPVEGERSIAVGERRIGTPLLWSPTADDEQRLRADWEELSGAIGRGDLEEITGHMGEVLQVRPKAASSYSRRRAADADGRAVDVMPRGFYLRARFTEAILARHFPRVGP